MSEDALVKVPAHTSIQEQAQAGAMYPYFDHRKQSEKEGKLVLNSGYAKRQD